MQPMRLQQIEQIFHAALDLEPEQVEGLLRERCAGDESLRGEGGVAPIAERKEIAADAEFAGRPRRNAPQIAVEHVERNAG